MPRTTRAVKDEAFSALSAEYQVAAHELNRRLVDGEIPVSVWRNGLQEQIKTLHVQAYVAGRSGEWDAVTQAEWGRVGQRLRTQYEYLRNWSLELAGPGLDNVSLAKLNVRADLYAAAARASFESAIAEEKGTPSGVLPAMPGDGSTRCLCIASPWSRVLTARGWVPIADIIPGDYVKTHKDRYRRVTSICRKQSLPSHRLVALKSPGHDPVFATDTHLWNMEHGWGNFVDICSSATQKIHVYGNGSWHMQNVRMHARESEYHRILHALSAGMSLWESEGYALRGMPELRHVPEGQGAVGHHWGQDAGFNPQGECEDAHLVRASELWQLPDEEAGWAAIRLLLEERPEALHVPISVGMDIHQWPDKARIPHPPYQRGLFGRPDRESGNDLGKGSPPIAWGRELAGISTEAWAKVRSMQRVLCAEDQEGPAGPVLLAGMLSRGKQSAGRVSSMLQDLFEGYGEGAETSVLLAGLLRKPIPLFDIEVEDDHSYIIEGMVSHNTNCKCGWAIRKRGRSQFATWRLGRAEHCDTCLARARSWKNLEIRDGVLVSQYEPIFYNR